ncbi:MAG: class I SAM-dependent methyltransferase [Streptosporangiaceae bacterium]
MTDQAAAGAAQVRDLFDAKAATWSAKYEAGGPLTGRLARLSAAVQARTALGDRVLDLGCGTGDLARRLAAAGRRVTGCDISGQMLTEAALAGPAQAVEWAALDADWHRLPFETGTFSAVVVSSVLEYVDDPVAILSECARVLWPGGALLCTVPDLRHPVRWLEWLAAVAAGQPVFAAVAKPLPSVDRHLAYLRVSRQRHTFRWWSTAAARAGLRDAASTEAPASRPPAGQQPLCLRVFTKPEEVR